MATETERVPGQAEVSRPEGGLEAQQTPILKTRADQRSRLLAAIVDLTAEYGYPDTKVADLVRRAGVSRATFYQLFENKEACVLAAQSELARRTLLEVELAVTRGEPQRGLQSAIAALVELADREPRVFDFLTHETMLAGSAAQSERDRLVHGLQQAIEAAWERAPGTQPLIDVSAQLVLEGAIRVLTMRMGRDGAAPRLLLGDLLTWVDYYTVQRGPAKWRAPKPEPALMSKPVQRPGMLSVHPSLPKGRHRLQSEIARSVQRERITYATAEAIRTHGYAELTVADIVATAGISRDAFYAQFHDKDEAFDGTAQLVFEQLLAKMGGAFFGDTGSWADQLWEAGWALEQFLEGEPNLAHFLFVASYSPPARIGRVLDFVRAFTLFVDGGNRDLPAASQVPHAITEAVVCAVLEAINLHVREDRVQDLRGLVPAIIYVVFAPFLGTEDAASFIGAKVEAERERASRQEAS